MFVCLFVCLFVSYLALHIEMEAAAACSVLHVQATLVLSLYEERRSFHLGKCVLEIVVEVVKVEIKISDPTSQLEEEFLIATLLTEGHEVLAHPLVELLVLQTQDLHTGLPHLTKLGLWVSLPR